MKDPQNLIYIILIVGSLIWSVVKKFASKKAETAQPQPNQTPQPKRTLEDIFRDLAGEFEPQPQTVPQPVVVQPIAQPVMNDAFAEKRIFPRQLVVQQELPQRTFDIGLETQNDWQRAFVYSEIFNRKY